MKITVIGLAGSGKTYLAERISRKLSIPHIHLDRFWFEAGGLATWKRGATETDKEQVRARIKERVAASITQSSWVSDGFYSRFQPEILKHADLVIFLDLPLWRRMLNHATRMLQPAKRHKEVSLKDDFIFFYEMVRRGQKNKPRLKLLMEQGADKAVILRSRKEIEQYLSHL